MAATNNKFKQRIIGAVILIALAIVFLPMLLKKEDPVREVVVQEPAAPETVDIPHFPLEDVDVPAPVVEETYEIVDESEVRETSAPAVSIPEASEPVAVQTPMAKPVTPKPVQKAAKPGIDKNNLPVSWSVQLASLTNKTNAEALRDTYRKKQYNAYVRSTDGVHRVLIGPLVKQAEAQSMCKSLKGREGQDCFVVRYAP